MELKRLQMRFLTKQLCKQSLIQYGVSWQEAEIAGFKEALFTLEGAAALLQETRSLHGVNMQQNKEE